MPRARSSTGCAPTTSSCSACCATSSDRTASRTPDQTSALGVFKDPALLPVVFPGLMEARGGAAAAGRRRRPHHRHRLLPNAQAIHHLEPIDDVVIREWRPDGIAAAGRRCCSAASPRAPSPPSRRTCRCCKREAGVAARAQRRGEQLARAIARRARSSTTSRAASCSTPTRASLKTTIDRMVYMSSDNEIVVTPRQGTGYVAVSIAFSDLHYSHKAEEDLRRALERDVRPDLVQHVGRPWRHRAAALLLRRSRRSNIRSTSSRCARSRRARHLHVGGPGRRDARADVRALEGRRAVQALRPHARRAAACIASRRAPRKCPEDLERLRDARSGARNQRPARHRPRARR